MAKPKIDLPPKAGGAVTVFEPEASENLPATQDADSATLSMIERAAQNPLVDVQKMRELLDMQDRVRSRRNEQAFNESMKLAQEDMPRVVRDAKNDSTSSKYARLETVTKAINPVVTRHGFSMSFGTADSPLPGHYRVTCLVSHIGGHSREYHVDVPADALGPKGNPNKTATHAFGSTMSYGRRYLTLLIFNVSLVNEDDDGNAAGRQPVTEEQVEEIQALIVKSAADIGKFCRFMKVASIADIPAARFSVGIDALNKYANKTAKKGAQQ